MKLGYIDYFNCFPLYYHMFHTQPLEGIEVVPGYPSELNRAVLEETLHMSPISSAAYADLRDKTLILSDFCLSSVGYVKSVILKSNFPIEELHRKKVGISRASRTSEVLLKILLQKYYSLSPEYIPTPPQPELNGLDAALVIGNEAMEESKQPVPYIYDLGDLWFRKTGSPVVFAIFVVNKTAAEIYKDRIKSIIESFKKSLELLDTDRENLIINAEKKYPDIKYNLDSYYKCLKYNFSRDLKDALKFYFDNAGELGLLPKVKSLEFISF